MVIYRFGDFELDVGRFELRRRALSIPLQPRAFDLLRYLVERPNVVVTKAELFEHVWSGVVVSTDSLTQAIMAVRTALDDKVDSPRFIHTVRGRGYRFVVEVETEGSSAARGEREPSESGGEAAEDGKSVDPRLLFVGRDESLAVAASHLARAREGGGSILLVTGPAGIGKTRFLAEIVARSRDAQPIEVQCSSANEGAPPLWPLVQVLRELAHRGHTFPTSVDALARGTLAPGTIETPATRFQLIEEVVDALLSCSRGQPLAMVLDDLHLADAHTHALLRRLSRRLVGERVLVIAAYRPTGTPDAISLATLAEEPTATTVPLGPLSRADVAVYLQEVLGRPAPDVVLDKIFDKTGGTPRFVARLVHVLRAENKLEEGGIATSALIGGDDMHAAIVAHLASLPESVARVLGVAAVFGAGFALAPLARVLETPNGAVLADLDVAEAARVVSRAGAGRYRFNYPVVRDVLYRRLPAAERARLHALAARALEAVLGDDAGHAQVAEVARHYADAAVTGDVVAAMDWSLRAAELALAAGDGAAAVAYAARGFDAAAFSPNSAPDRRARLATLSRGAR